MNTLKGLLERFAAPYLTVPFLLQMVQVNFNKHCSCALKQC